MTAASVDPPPISTIMCPDACAIGILAPMAAASGSSMRYANVRPGRKCGIQHGPALYLCHTLGTQIITSGLKNPVSPDYAVYKVN